jgi:hypothetical protein
MAKNYPQTQFDELKKHFPNAKEFEEGYEYILLPALSLPNGEIMDVLLCPQLREGYHSRLFFADKFELNEEKPWSQFYIGDKNWYAYSWQPPTGLTLVQMIGNHLKAVKNEKANSEGNGSS